MKLHQLLLINALLGLTACSSVPKESKEYLQFAEQKNYKQTYAIYTDKKLLSEAKKDNTSAKINLEKQRIRLVIDGRTAVDSPATTGKKDYDTPTGTFKIIDKLAKKESNLYGTFYKEGKRIFTGSEKEYKEEHDGEELDYDDYKGAALDNWLRLTRDGVGIHQSKGIYRRPASHGCVRVPSKTSALLFTRLFEGSTVEVIQNTETEKLAKARKKNITKTEKNHPSEEVAKASYKDKNLPIAERLRLLREHKKS